MILSIIIPTRNRAKYAISAIRSVLSYSDRDFELIVQDNSENEELGDALSQFSDDPRLKYFHVVEPLNVIANFTQGLLAATGKYVTFFGDDDGANPEVVDIARWADENSIDCVVSTRPSEFAWPDKKYKFFQEQLAGRLDIRPFSGTAKLINVEEELRKCAQSGGVLSRSVLPNAYRGLVRRACFDQLLDTTGTYFPGPSPDLSMAIGLSPVVKRLIQVDYPIFVPGASLGNVHARGRSDYQDYNLATKEHLPKDFVDSWSAFVPKYFSGPSIWGETAVQALKRIGREDLLEEFGTAQVHARCAVFLPTLRVPIIQNLLRLPPRSTSRRLFRMLRFGVYFIATWLERLRNAMANAALAKLPNWRNHAFQNVQTIHDAVQCLEAFLERERIRFRDNVPEIITANR